MNNITLYYTSYFFFKLAIGGLLILVGWDSLKFNDDSFLNISIITLLTFIPATFSKFIYNFISKINNKKILSIILFFLSISFIFETFLLKLIFYMNFFFILHFINWILIFIAEIYFEIWFVNISKEKNPEEIRKISSNSMLILQISIIIGPIIILNIDSLFNLASYTFCSLSFILSSYFSFSLKNRSYIIDHDLQKKNKIKKFNIFPVIVFSSIWPTLSVFNLDLPILSKIFYDNSFSKLIFIEILFGISSGFSGIIYNIMSKKIQTFLFEKIIFIIIFSNLNLIFFYKSFLITSLIFSVNGFIYGLLRVISKTQLAKEYSFEEVSSIISIANSLNVFFVTISIAINYFELKLFIFNSFFFTLPILFIISSVLMWRFCNDSK